MDKDKNKIDCPNCIDFKNQIREQVSAFKILSSLTKSLDPEILVQSLEKVIGYVNPQPSSLDSQFKQNSNPANKISNSESEMDLIQHQIKNPIKKPTRQFQRVKPQKRTRDGQDEIKFMKNKSGKRTRGRPRKSKLEINSNSSPLPQNQIQNSKNHEQESLNDDVDVIPIEPIQIEVDGNLVTISMERLRSNIRTVFESDGESTEKVIFECLLCDEPFTLESVAIKHIQSVHFLGLLS